MINIAQIRRKYLMPLVRPRRFIYFKRLQSKVNQLSLLLLLSNTASEQYKRRVNRMANRLEWLGEGYSPWYDGSVVHKDTSTTAFGIPISENMSEENKDLLAARFAEWRKQNPISDKDRERDKIKQQKIWEKYVRDTLREPLLVRLASLVGRRRS